VSGSNILLDTNAFIYYFEGRSKITELVVNATRMCYSPISEIELLSATSLSLNQLEQIKAFLLLCERIDLSATVVAEAILVRRDYRFKTPDAVIAGTALDQKITLVSADAAFSRVVGLTLISDILD
jgi:predicted nucleic acid-binding protein